MVVVVVVVAVGMLVLPFWSIDHLFFMALAIYQVTYSDRKFCWSVCLSVGPGFASLGTST